MSNRRRARRWPNLSRYKPMPATRMGLLTARFVEERVDSGRGQNRTLRSLSAFWPPVFAGEQDVGPPKG